METSVKERLIKFIKSKKLSQAKFEAIMELEIYRVHDFW